MWGPGGVAVRFEPRSINLNLFSAALVANFLKEENVPWEPKPGSLAHQRPNRILRTARASCIQRRSLEALESGSRAGGEG